MPLRLALSALALLAPAAAHAQHGFALTPPVDPALRTITVTGQGTAEAEADEAHLRFVVDTEGETVEDAIRLHEAEVDRVTAVLRAAGIADSNVTLDRLGLGSEEDEFSFEGSATGEEEKIVVSRTVTVRVRDLDAVTGLVARIASADDDPLVVQSRSVTVGFAVRDERALRERALRGAVADARRRADLVAGSAGVRVGRVLSVTEGGVTASLVAGGSTVPLPGMAAALGGLSASGTQATGASVVVVYAVEE